MPGATLRAPSSAPPTSRKVGKSPRTVRQAHLRLSQGLGQALTSGLVSPNVAHMITAPAREERAERPTWTTEQAQAFLSVSREYCIYGPIFRISLATGVRRGELLGLRWADIAWQAHLLRVRQSVGPIHTSMTPGSPKSSSSNRDVTVADALLGDLQDHRARQNEQRLKLGADWHDLDLVFCSEVGMAIQAPNLYREYRRWRRWPECCTSLSTISATPSPAGQLLRALIPRLPLSAWAMIPRSCPASTPIAARRSGRGPHRPKKIRSPPPRNRQGDARCVPVFAAVKLV